MSFKNKSKSFLTKLNTREVFGGFKKKSTISAIELFDSLPENHFLQLDEVFANLGNHVFMGPTQCGRFLLTYSINQCSRTSDFMLSQLYYTLHLWSFSRVPWQSKKVAEIILFSGFSSEISNQLHISVAQWPTIYDKIIVYGESEPICPKGGEFHTSNTFLTIAQLPSLHKCLQCDQVAKSFQQSDTPISEWERYSNINHHKCLQHGMTLDAMFYLAHPHPKFDISTNIKFPNTFLINTGNFLHILSMELKPSLIIPDKPQSTIPIEENSKIIVNERVQHKVTHKICKNTIMFKHLYVEDSSSNVKKKNSTNYFFMNSKKDEQENYNIGKYTRTHQEQRGPSGEVKNIMAHADKVYAFEECEDGCELKFKWFRKRKLADKMYEFCSDEDEMENARFSNLLKELRHEYEKSSPKSSKVSFGRFLKIRLNPEKKSQETSIRSSTTTTNYHSPRDREDDEELHTSYSTKTDFLSQSVPSPRTNDSSFHSELFLKTDTFCSKPDNCDISSIISDWESQDTNSLSPKSDISNLSDFSTSSMPGTSTGSIRFSLKNKKPRQSLKKYTCTNVSSHTSVDSSSQHDRHTRTSSNLAPKSLCVILKPQNRLCLPLEETKNMSVKLDKKCMDAHCNVHVIPGCSLDVDRYFVFDETSWHNIPPESDVDCCEDGTQVPIVVRGPGGHWTSRLKLINDVDNLSQYEHCLVKQKTVDIEQFCFKAADLICKNELFVFRSCNDYDVDIVDMCPFSGDVIAVVSIKMNAVSVNNVPPKKKYSLASQRRSDQFLADIKQEFDTSCVLVWNVDSLVCRVEAYTPLKPLIDCEWNNQTQEIAKKIRLQNVGFFNVPSLKPRSFAHRLKKDGCGGYEPRDSMKEIIDLENLVGFRLDKRLGIDDEDDDEEEEDIEDESDLDDLYTMP